MATDIFGAASGAIGGVSAGAKIGAFAGPVGAGIGAVVGGLAGLFSGGKKNEAKREPLNIAKIITDTRTAAAENYKNSISLEQQYNPGQAALRPVANQALQTLAAGTGNAAQASNAFLPSLLAPGVDASVSGNPLLDESANRILQNLRLGGALGADVQAQAMQAALQKGGAAGISGSGAARGLVARDIGETSERLKLQRIAQAQDAGAKMAGLNLQGQQLRLQDLVARGQLTQAAANAEAARLAGVVGLIDARPLPSAGLDPGAIASLYIGENNAQSQFNTLNSAIAQQQKNSSLNSLLGFGTTALSSGAFGQGIDAIKGLFKSKIPAIGGGDGGEPY